MWKQLQRAPFGNRYAPSWYLDCDSNHYGSYIRTVGPIVIDFSGLCETLREIFCLLIGVRDYYYHASDMTAAQPLERSDLVEGSH